MNKRILMAVALAACILQSATAFAAASITATTSIGGLGFTPSNKVPVYAAATAGTPGTTVLGSYAAGSGHFSGSRTFATDSTASIIYWKDNAGAALSNPITGADQTFSNVSGWTSM